MGPIRIDTDPGLALRMRQTLAIAVAAGSALLPTACSSDELTKPADIEATTTSAAERTTTTAEVTTTTEVECASWEMPGLPINDKHRVLTGGLPQLGAAQNEGEARTALADWVALITVDKDVMAGYASEIIGEEVVADSLVDDDGCATDTAEDVRSDVELTIAMSEVSDGSTQVPADSTNTGVDAGGQVVAADAPGISGNTNGVTFKTKDGEEFGAMERCGNLTKRGAPKAPKGPTDEVFEMKTDKNTTPAGVPGQNRGSGTAPSGPTGPGKGPSGQKPNPQGSVEGDAPVAAPAEEKTTIDTDSRTEVPAPTPGVEENPNKGGNGTPAAPVTEVPVQGGQGGATDPNNV